MRAGIGPTESAVGTATFYFSLHSLIRGFLDHLFLHLKIESFRNKKMSGDGNTADELCRII